MSKVKNVCLIFANFIRFFLLRLFSANRFSMPLVSLITLSTKISLHKKARLSIGQKFRTRYNVELNAREGKLTIGNNVFMNSGCIVTCRESIQIGENTIFGPGVFVYDHDHIFGPESGIKHNEYASSPIEIGKNVWIAANCVVLKGTKIGDNCVISAGSIVKGEIPSNSIYYQKKETIIKEVV